MLLLLLLLLLLLRGPLRRRALDVRYLTQVVQKRQKAAVDCGTAAATTSRHHGVRLGQPGQGTLQIEHTANVRALVPATSSHPGGLRELP